MNNEYRYLLEQCPGIEKHVIFRSSEFQPKAFECSWLTPTEKKKQGSQQIMIPTSTSSPKPQPDILDMDTRTISPVQNPETKSPPTTAPRVSTPELQITNGHDDMYLYLQHLVFDNTNRWILKNPDHPYTLKWHQLTRDGLTDITTFDELKNILLVPNLEQYFCFLRGSPALQHTMSLSWHNQQIEFNSFSEIPTDEPHDTPKQDNWTAEEISVISYSSLLTDEGNYIQVRSTEDFMILHYTIDRIVQQWSLQGPTHHPFYVKWQKWMMQGLSKDNSWEHICKVMGIASYEEYVTHINECPLVQQLYHIIWQQGTISHVKISHTTDGMDENIMDLRQQLIQLQHNLMMCNKKSDDLDKRLRDVDDHLHASHDVAVDRINRAKTSINQLVTQQQKILLDTAEELKDDLQSHAQFLSQGLFSDWKNQLMLYADTIELKVKTATTTVETMMEEGITKIQQAVEGKLTDFKAGIAHLPSSHNATADKQEASQHIPAKRFTATMDPAYVNHLMHNVPTSSTKNPYRSAAEHPACDAPTQHMGDPWNAPKTQHEPTFHPGIPTLLPSITTSPSTPVYIPPHSSQPYNTEFAQYMPPQGVPPYGQFNQQQFIGQGLPPINPDQYSKRVKAIYSGLDDIFSFYNQLHNASAQWGDS
jgi:hypothetical protein